MSIVQLSSLIEWWHHQRNEHESEWTPGVGDGQGGLACCDSWGHRVGHDWATELNWKGSWFLLIFLKAEPTGFPDGQERECVRKRGLKNDFRFWPKQMKGWNCHCQLQTGTYQEQSQWLNNKAFAIYLYWDLTPCCYSWRPSTTPMEIQSWMRHSVLQGIWWTGL